MYKCSSVRSEATFNNLSSVHKTEITEVYVNNKTNFSFKSLQWSVSHTQFTAISVKRWAKFISKPVQNLLSNKSPQFIKTRHA